MAVTSNTMTIHTLNTRLLQVMTVCESARSRELAMENPLEDRLNPFPPKQRPDKLRA